MTTRRPLVTIGGVLQELPFGDTVIGAPVAEAPVDGKQYARKDGAWAEVSTTASSEQNVFIQNSPPAVTGGLPYLWVQTGVDGSSMTFWVEDGS